MRTIRGRILVFSIIGALLAGVLVFVAIAAEIHDAARAGNLARVKELVEKDPGLVKALDNSRSTPLHYAAIEGRFEVASYLIDKGAVIDEKDGLGRTPFWWCFVRGGTLDVARLLLDKGADINAEGGGPGSWTPLVMAAFQGRPESVDFLLEHGAALPPSSDFRFTLLQTFAAEKGLTRLMNQLIATGADYRWRDDAGSGLMHKAAAGGSVEFVELFAKAGLSVADANIFGWTPLHYAAEKGRTRTIEMLLAKGAPVDARTRDGKTAYNLAREWGMKDAADILAAKGADRSDPQFPLVTGSYFGQKPPGKIPELFGLGIVASKYAFHGGVSFTPDGTEAYWSVQDFGGAMASLESKQVGGRWTPPKLASFAAIGRNDDVPFPSPDGKKLYFVSMRPLDKGGQPGKENIWVMERTASGWSEPKPLPPVVNSAPLHWQVSVDLRGNLYFGGRIEGEVLGVQDIYCAKFENGQYAKPVNLGPAINGAGMRHSPFIAPDGSYLLYSVSNPLTRVDSLFISFRKSDGTWTRGRELNSIIQYRSRSMCPWVTPDGKYLFFEGTLAAENEPYWVDASFIEDLRKVELLPSACAAIQATLEKEGLAAAQAKFKELRARPEAFGFSERDFNALGYKLMNAGDIQNAIGIFRMNVELFPESANVYDSLGEAYFNAQDYENARTNYQLSLAKNPNSPSARRMLATLEQAFQRAELERQASFKPGQPTGLQGPYLGQKPPGLVPEMFAPGIVSMLAPSDYACTVSPDGREFYFTRAKSGGVPQEIMFCRLEKDGWTAPEPVKFSAGYSAHEPHITADNKKIYWGWFRPVPAGEVKPEFDYGIYVSERNAAGWSEAKYVGQGMFVSSSRSGQIYVTDPVAGYLAKAELVNGRFSKLDRVTGALDHLRPRYTNFAHPCIAPDESYLLFDVEGGWHLFVSFRGADGAWGEPIDLAEHGLDRAAGMASITRDGKLLFFSANGDLYWVSTQYIENLRPRAK
jgi:ankyrin repeat protein